VNKELKVRMHEKDEIDGGPVSMIAVLPTCQRLLKQAASGPPVRAAAMKVKLPRL
jgi:hypothetical protein